jgi:hypothetical protein
MSLRCSLASIHKLRNADPLLLPQFAHNPFSHHAMIHLYSATAARNRHRAAGPALAECTAILAANGYEDGAATMRVFPAQNHFCQKNARNLWNFL